MAALAEMYVQGVSTRKVKAITEELCGHSFSASSISAINQRLDASLAQFAGRALVEAFPYLILDGRYERVREAGVIASQAVLIAIGIDWDGRRQVLAVELANRESRSSWRDFLRGLKARGLSGVEFVVADDHAGPLPQLSCGPVPTAPGQESRTAPARIAIAPKKMRRSTFSRKTTQAIAIVARPSLLSRSAPIEAGVSDRPDMSRAGPRMPPNSTIALSPGRSRARSGASERPRLSKRPPVTTNARPAPEPR